MRFSLNPKIKNREIYLNLKYSIIFENRTFFVIEISNFDKKIQTQISISIRDYKNKIINVTKFIIINLYFSNTLNDNLVFAKIFIKMHLIKNLKINIFIETNILILY